jgi:hypothetical protein
MVTLTGEKRQGPVCVVTIAKKLFMPELNVGTRFYVV